MARKIMAVTSHLVSDRGDSERRDSLNDLRRMPLRADSGPTSRNSVEAWVQPLVQSNVENERPMSHAQLQTFLRDASDPDNDQEEDLEEALQEGSLDAEDDEDEEEEAAEEEDEIAQTSTEEDEEDENQDIEEEEGDEADNDTDDNEDSDAEEEDENPARPTREHNTTATISAKAQKINKTLDRPEHADECQEDAHAELMLALSKVGKEHFGQDNERASKNLGLALEYARRLSARRYSQHDLTEERLMLASIHLQRQEVDEAEEHLKTVTGESVMTGDNAPLICEAYYKLSRIYFLRSQFDDALAFCRRCVHDLGKALGKESEPYRKAVQLLVLIYRAKGQNLEANALEIRLSEKFGDESRSQVKSPLTNRTASSSARTSTTGSSLHSKLSASLRNDHGPSSDHSQSPDLFSDKDFATELFRIKTASSTAEYCRHPSLNKDMDAATILTCAGFTGDFDSAKALTWAIAGNHLKVVKYLLDGYQVSKSRRSKFSLGRDTEKIEIRTAGVNGAPVTSHFGARRTPIPLLFAIEHGRVPIAKLLLDRGASCLVKDSQGRSPLRAASEGGHLEIVRLLLEKGAPVETPSPAPVDPVRPASRSSRSGPTGKSVPYNRPRSVRLFSALHGAAAHGHDAILAALLAAGARPDARDRHGSTALQIACARGHTGCVRLLLEHGGSPDRPDDAGWTPLMAAAHGGHETAARLLLRTGRAALDASNRAGQSALTVAAAQGRETVAKALLNAGAHCEHADARGWTALLGAADGGHERIIVLLLAAGANINARSNLGSTALDRAEYARNLRLMEFLRRGGAVHGTKATEKGAVMAYTGYMK